MTSARWNNIKWYVNPFQSEFCEERREFEGSSSEHLAGYSAAEPDLACGQEEPYEKVPRHVCRNVEKNDDYQKFYEQFGKCLKLGIHEDSTDRTKIAELFMCKTSKTGDEQISLKEHVDRMKEGAERHLFHHCREHRRRVLFLGKFGEEGS